MAMMDAETAPRIDAGPGLSGWRAKLPAHPALATAQQHVRITVAYVRLLWANASTSTRVMLGAIALLLVFLLARSGQEPKPEPRELDDDASSASSASPAARER